MNYISVERCFAYAGTQGKRIKKQDLAKKLWPNSTFHAQKTNMSNLIMGRTDSIKPEWVQIICEYCGVDANYLFNIKPMQHD